MAKKTGACPCSTGAEQAPAVRFSYEGNMRCVATGAGLTIDAPKASGGQGQGPCPVDLLGYAHGACVAMVMAMVAQRDHLDLKGMKVESRVQLAEGPSRKVASIQARFILPRKVSAADLAKLQRAAGTCPVHNSLHPDVKVSIEVVAPK